MSSISEIIFEHIDDKYAYGQYGEFKVIIMKENKYINATKLCSTYNKLFKNWLQNENSKKLINTIDNTKDTFSLTAGIPAVSNKSIIKINGGYGINKEINGTYVH